MEIYKRKVGYQDYDRTNNLIITGTTLYFPFFLTQNLEDIGIYTDVNNTVPYVVTGLTGVWNTTGITNTQKPCLVNNVCTFTDTITQSSAVSNTGTITVSAIGGCTYSSAGISWTGPNNFVASPSSSLNLTNLAPGNYTLKIVQDNCDITYKSYFVPQSQSLSYSNLIKTDSQTNANIACGGSASVTPQGGTPPYTYNWYSGVTSNSYGNGTIATSSVISITGLCAGTYTVQITDSNGTTVSAMFNITQQQQLGGSILTQTNVDCFGNNTGNLTVVGSGGTLTTGYSYTLSASTPVVLTTNTTGLFTNLVSASYLVVITDNVGSTYNIPVTITQPVIVTSVITPTNVGCFGESNGSIVVTPSGGNSSYDIRLDKGTSIVNQVGNVTSYSFNGLSSGYYKVTVFDTNGCPGPVSYVTLTEEALLNVNYSVPTLTNGYNIPCYGQTIPLTATTTYTTGTYTRPLPGGTITYQLNNVISGTCIGPNCSTIINVPAGEYELKNININGCEQTTNLTITQPPMALSVISGLITVEDNACQTTTGSVDVSGFPQLNVPVTFVYGCSDTPGGCRQAVIDVNGGVAPYTIVWSDGGTTNGTTSNAHCVGYGNITATVTDSNGCVLVKTITI